MIWMAFTEIIQNVQYSEPPRIKTDIRSHSMQKTLYVDTSIEPEANSFCNETYNSVSKKNTATNPNTSIVEITSMAIIQNFNS